MRGRRLQIGILAGLGLLLAGAIAAYAATNTVPSTRLDVDTLTINANALKPAACAALNLTDPVISGSGALNGTNANDLILGSVGIDSLDGRNGADCLMAGSGDDALTGGPDDDVLLGGDGNDNLSGGQGNDTIDGGSGTDTCDGGPGADTATNCETLINIP